MIKRDKRLHFVCAFVMAVCLLILLYLLDVKYGFIIANGFTLLFWIGKEVFDCYKPNPTGFSGMDLIADLAGMMAANIVFMILKM